MKSAGHGVLHPLALAALIVLVLNDHLFKAWFPGTWWTGKLSDFAGLTFFPLFLVALYERSLAWRGRFTAPSPRPLLLAVLATGAVFAWVELSESGEHVYRYGLGALQSLFLFRFAPVSAYADPSDCLALVALLLPLWIGMRRAS